MVTEEGEFTEFTIGPLHLFLSAGEKGDAGYAGGMLRTAVADIHIYKL